MSLEAISPRSLVLPWILNIGSLGVAFVVAAPTSKMTYNLSMYFGRQVLSITTDMLEEQLKQSLNHPHRTLNIYSLMKTNQRFWVSITPLSAKLNGIIVGICVGRYIYGEYYKIMEEVFSLFGREL